MYDDMMFVCVAKSKLCGNTNSSSLSLSLSLSCLLPRVRQYTVCKSALFIRRLVMSTNQSKIEQ